MTICKVVIYSYESIPSKTVGTIEVIARGHMGDLESRVSFFVPEDAINFL